MQNRQQHQQQVEAFLQQTLHTRDWTFTLPPGTGNETYFAHGNKGSYFIKVGAYTERAISMSEAGLTPTVIASGYLPDGSTVMVQPLIESRSPTRADLQARLEQVARMVGKMHGDPHLIETLPRPATDLHRDGAVRALAYVHEQWPLHKDFMPDGAKYIDNALIQIEQEARQLPGRGLVASHGDFCNANMLITPGGNLYIIDLELMSLDDPALDLGAVLWWYYPPNMRRRFIEAAGYEDTPDLRHRMRVRMALHCLCAALPRPTGFDTLDPASYTERLADFRAVFEDNENPQGY